jgi:septum formation protein
MILHPPLILASKSPRRCELLRRCGVDFEQFSSEVQEVSSGEDIVLLPQKNAELKAAAAAEVFPDRWVLGADTMIIFQDHAIGKPQDMADAAEILQKLSGRQHRVVTGMALLNRQKNIREVWRETSVVSFKKLDARTIAAYLAAVDVMDKAGAYAIQENGGMIVESFTGELENIIGLPLKKLQTLLNRYAVAGK